MVLQSDNDVVTVVGAGVTLHEALTAAEMLKKEGMSTLPPAGSGVNLHLFLKYISLNSFFFFFSFSYFFRKKYPCD